MRRSILLTAIFGTLILGLSVPAPHAGAATGEGAPRAVPIEPIKDFEIVAKGEEVHHTFEIKNEGNATLELTDVRPACGCTVAEFDSKIAPGEIGQVRTTLQTLDFYGPISKSVAVFTNDPDNPKIQLVLKANVKPYVGINPGYARFIYVQGEHIEPITQTLWPEDNHALNVLEVRNPYDFLEVEVHKAVEGEIDPRHPEPQWLVTVELDPYSPVGALREYVEVTTDHPKQKIVRIPISGFVRPRQHVTPHELNLGVLDGDSLPLRRELDFTNFITAGIEVKSVETGIAGLTAEVRETGRQDGHRFKVTLTVGPEVPKGALKSVLKLHITDQKNPIVEVPIEGTVL